MKAYTVKYRIDGEDIKEICILAQNKAEAYDKAFYEVIPKVEGEIPYSAWVDGYTVLTHGGYKYHQFRTSEGNAY